VVFSDLGIALAAGVSVFGSENQGGTRRFLNQHAAQPQLVWLVKLGTWCLGLGAILGAQAILAGLVPVRADGHQDAAVLGLLSLPLAFATAQFCGMAIDRGITALAAAVVLTSALAAPLLTLVFFHLLPLWGLLIPAVALLVVTRAWSADWLQDRPAPGRWLRLGLLLLGTLAVVSTGYAGYRVLSVPDVALVAAPQSWIRAEIAAPPARGDAPELYREAAHRLKSARASQVPATPTVDQEALELVRRAAALPECWFAAFDELTATSQIDVPLMDQLARLVIHDVEESQRSGNLDGAWKDIVVLFQVARQLSEGTATLHACKALLIEQQALGLALDWAVAPRQTPERLRSAISAYQTLPKIAPADEVVRAWAHLVERMLDLPSDKLRDRVASRHITDEPWNLAWMEAATTPWELERARRVNRVFAAATLQTAARDPIRRLVPSSGRVSSTDVEANRTSAPLANLFLADLAPYFEVYDRNEVGRRALLQVLALRTWQLRHGGQFPDRLSALVPEELAGLPGDPYSGSPFGYARAEEHLVPPLRSTLSYWLSSTTLQGGGLISPEQSYASSKQPSGSRLLYSVGPNLRDDQQTTTVFGEGPQYDIVFAIPPLEADSAKPKELPGPGGLQ
jgi:hypothetical protein